MAGRQAAYQLGRQAAIVGGLVTGHESAYVRAERERERFIPRPARWLNKKTFTAELPLSHVCGMRAPLDYPKIGRSKRYLPPKTEFHVMDWVIHNLHRQRLGERVFFQK